MALFETMRENTKVILWITVLAFVGLIFLAWGADYATKSKSSGQEPGVLGRVNGEALYARDYSRLFEDSRASYEQEQGRLPDEKAQVGLAAETWQRMVDGALMRQMAAEHDIVVTDQEVANALLYAPLPQFRSLPAFLDEQGRFDPQRYQAWVADPRTNTLPLEEQYREMLMVQKLRMLALSTVKVSGEEVRSAWVGRNEKADIAYALVPYLKIPSEEQIADEELEDYLRSHEDQFRATARAALEYVRIDKRPTAEDTLEAMNQMDEVRHSLAQGEDFMTLVQSYSEATRDRWGGEQGRHFPREELAPPALRDAAFTLPVGQVSELISGPAGLHILRVEDRKTENGVELVKFAEIFIPIEMSYETNFAIQDRLLDLVDSTGVAAFREAAESAGLTVQETGPFDPEGFVPGLSRVAAAKEFAQRGEPGKPSRPVEAADAWYVFHLVERRPPEIPPLEEIRRSVRNAYLLDYRKQTASAHMREILDRARGGLPLDQAAALDTLAAYYRADGVVPQGQIRGIGYDPALNAAVFEAQVPGLLPELIVGNQAVFVVEILSPPVFDQAAFDAQKEQLRQRLLEQKQSQAAEQWMERVRKDARIEDYRPVISSM